MINKIKPIYLLLALLLIVIPILLLLLSLLRPSPSEPREERTPATTLTPSPTIVPTLPPGVVELRIIRAAPIQNPQIAYLPVQSIELTFTETVFPEDLRYSIEPHMEVTIRQGSISNALIIRPEVKWQNGETIVTILPSTTTQTGARLAAPYIYRMISALPPAPQEGNY